MKDLDYSKLQPLSSNNAENKTNLARENECCREQLEIYLDNFKDYMLSLKVYDMASLLIAEQDWLRRYNKNKAFQDSLIGKILRVDFGKMYLYENGLIHFAVCIGEHQGKYCVIPMTTSNDEIKAAYHPQFRPTGEKRLYLLKKADGNIKDSALYMNDMKYISGGRIIKVGNKISDVAYNNIIQLAAEISLSNIYRENCELKKIVTEFKEKNDLLIQLNNAIKTAQNNQ